MNGKLRKILMAVLAAVFVTGIGLSVYQSYQYAQAQQLQDRAQQLVQVPEPKPVELLPEVDTPLAPAPALGIMTAAGWFRQDWTPNGQLRNR